MDFCCPDCTAAAGAAAAGAGAAAAGAGADDAMDEEAEETQLSDLKEIARVWRQCFLYDEAWQALYIKHNGQISTAAAASRDKGAARNLKRMREHEKLFADSLEQRSNTRATTVIDVASRYWSAEGLLEEVRLQPDRAVSRFVRSRGRR